MIINMIYKRNYKKIVTIISGEPGLYRLTIFKNTKVNPLIIYQADSYYRTKLKKQIQEIRNGIIKNQYEKFGKKNEIVLKIGLNECIYKR